MRYILNSHIALRTWRRVPCAYYVKGERDAKGLKQEEFDFLCACDGLCELPAPAGSPLAAQLLARGLIRIAQEGEAPDAWSLPRLCDNRYFPAMNWMITGRCNYNCLHCFNAADNAPLMSQWTLAEAEALLDDAQQCGINALTLTGGEPLCHPDFFPILEGIYRRGMYVEELNTNGFFLTNEVLERMDALGCKPLMKISFDGLGYHDWMRCHAGAQEDALRAIRLCLTHGFCVKVQMNVNRKNLSSLLPTADLLGKMGVSELRIIRTTESPRWVQNADGMTLSPDEYYERMLEFVAEYLKTPRKMSLDIWQFLTLYPRQRAFRLRPIECADGEYRDTLPVCRGNRGMVAVTADGGVYPCMQMSGYYEMRGDLPGNAKKDGLQALLRQSRYLDEVCTTVGTLAAVNETCGKCPYFRYCVGGCRAIALALTGDKLGSDPAKCLFFRKGYVQKLRALFPDWLDLAPAAQIP